MSNNRLPASLERKQAAKVWSGILMWLVVKLSCMHETNEPELLVLYADDDPDDIQYVSELLLEDADNIQLLSFPDAESL